MTLTRKQAICVLLGLPAAAQVAPKALPGDLVAIPENPKDWAAGGRTITITPMPKTGTLMLTLADKGGDDAGIDGITVDYHGQTRRITAAEIWEALDDGVR